MVADQTDRVGQGFNTIDNKTDALRNERNPSQEATSINKRRHTWNTRYTRKDRVRLILLERKQRGTRDTRRTRRRDDPLATEPHLDLERLWLRLLLLVMLVMLSCRQACPVFVLIKIKTLLCY